MNYFGTVFANIYSEHTNTTFQFSHKQLVLVNGPCFYRGFLFSRFFPRKNTFPG